MEPERGWIVDAILLMIGLAASAAGLWAFFNIIKLWAMQ